MKRRRLALLAGGALAAAALAVAGSAIAGKPAATPTPKVGGTVIFGAEQEPPCLNGALAGCNNTWTSWTAATSLRGLYIETPDFKFVPDMADGEAKVLSKKPFTLQFKIKKEAVWSDGVPVTVADFIFTWKAYVNPKNDVASRSGWDSISQVKQIDSKTANVVFKKPYAPWPTLLLNSLYPAHALTGATSTPSGIRTTTTRRRASRSATAPSSSRTTRRASR